MHRLDPVHMPFEAKLRGHCAVAVPVVAVGASSPCARASSARDRSSQISRTDHSVSSSAACRSIIGPYGAVRVAYSPGVQRRIPRTTYRRRGGEIDRRPSRGLTTMPQRSRTTSSQVRPPEHEVTVGHHRRRIVVGPRRRRPAWRRVCASATQDRPKAAADPPCGPWRRH